MDELHVVLLECGHYFAEHTATSVDPHHPSWKRRVCGHSDHYPQQYDAVYLPPSCIPPWSVLGG